jgi:hypothetical protein
VTCRSRVCHVVCAANYVGPIYALLLSQVTAVRKTRFSRLTNKRASRSFCSCNLYPNISWLIIFLKTPWPVSANELYRPSDRRLSAKLLTTFAYRGCHKVSAADPSRPYSRISRPEPLFYFRAAPQLYSRGWVDPVPDPLLLRKSRSTGNRTRTSGSVTRSYDH